MNSRRWLILSVLLNAALLGVLATKRHLQPAPPIQKPERPPQTAAPAVAPVTIKAGPSMATTLPTDWVSRLRAAGVPEKLVASIAAADYENRWQKKLESMKKRFAAGEIGEDEFSRFLAEHDTGEESELRGTLGDAGFHRWDREKVLRDFDLDSLKLSDSDSDALYQLQKKFNQQRHDLQIANLNGDVDEATLEQQSESKQDDYEKQLKTLLGDAKYASLQPGDSTVGNLRRSLAKVNASDEQVDGMLKAQQQWQDARAKVEAALKDGKITAQDYDQQTKTIDAARDQLYQQTLGPDAFADLQKNQDTRYQTMQRYAGAWNLSDNDVNHLYGALQFYENNVRDYQQRAQQLEAKGQPVDWDAVQKILHDFSQQTDTALQKYLGEDRFTKMKQTGALGDNP